MNIRINETKINCAIIGNGNLGRACREQMLKRKNEFNLIGMFSRRPSANTILLEEIEHYKDAIDVAFFCGGSNTDAAEMVPYLNGIGLSTVDSYDNHGEIRNQNYQNKIRPAALKSGTTAIIGAGWDPGYLSLQRIYSKAFMTEGTHNTFYGGLNGGLSMGHTNAIKTIKGVIAAHQLTVTREDAIDKALSGGLVDKKDCHKRVCFVVAEKGSEQGIEKQIREMEGYFKDQMVEVHFIGMEEFTERFAGQFGHAGQLISTDSNAKINLKLEMESNPLFTANAMLAFGKANFTMQQKGMKGVFTVDEIPPAYLSDELVRLGEI